MRTSPKDTGALSSLWQDTRLPRFDTAPEAHADVCIIGAGIAGLTTAFELVRRGEDVVGGETVPVAQLVDAEVAREVIERLVRTHNGLAGRARRHGTGSHPASKRVDHVRSRTRA